MDKLLVQIGAQPRKFVLVAQIRSSNHFVELFGPCLVVETGRHVRERPVGPHRHHAFFALVSRFAIGFHIRVRLDFLLRSFLDFAFARLRPRFHLGL